MKFSVNIEPLYEELDFCDRIPLIKKAGYDSIEFWSWADKDVGKIKETCEKYGVSISGFKGDQDYSLCDCEHTQEFIDSIKQSIETAKYLKCDSMIIHSNHFEESGSSDFRDKYSDAAHIANMTHALTLLAPILEENGIRMFIEPLNNLGTDGGMYLVDTVTTADIIRAVNSPNILLLADIYHVAMMQGNLLNHLADTLDIMPYVHVADAPDRHEPGTGEICYEILLKKLLEKGFDGTICYELWPTTMENALASMENLRRSLEAAE